MGYTVLTIEPQCREAAADVETWNKWRRAIWKWLQKECGAYSGVERTDPAGDEHPADWHPHLNLLWVKQGGFAPWIDLDALREKWCEITGGTRNLFGKAVVEVHHEYSDEPGKLSHWYSYMGRTWAHWRASVPRHLTVRWMGKKLAKAHEPGAACCDLCGAPFDVIRCGSEAEADWYATMPPAVAWNVAWARGLIDWRQPKKEAG